MFLRSFTNGFCLLMVIQLVGLALAGCELEGVEPGEAGVITLEGEASGGGLLGIGGQRVMVDSTVLVRALVADTTGVPKTNGNVEVAWSVSQGSVDPEVSVVSGDGLASTEWTLGTTASNTQDKPATVTAEIVGAENIAPASVDANVLPGPPAIFTATPEALQIQEGETGTVAVDSLADKYGNALSDFNFSLESSDATVAEVVSGGVQALVRGTGGGEATLIYIATGDPNAGTGVEEFSIQTQIPVTVQAFQGFFASFTDVAAGGREAGSGSFACGIAAPGTEAAARRVYCWGSNTDGRLGLPNLSRELLRAPRPEMPVQGIPESATVTQLAAGRAHACARTESGAIYCWGNSGRGRLGHAGDGQTAQAVDASAIEGSPVFTDVAAGQQHTCALTEEGEVYCWGDNTSAQLGVGLLGSLLPAPNEQYSVQGLEGVQVTALASSGPTSTAHTCAIADSGDLYCWGANGDGQIGTGSVDGENHQQTAVAVVPGETGEASFTSASTAGGFTCASAGDGTLYCWGSGFFNPTGAVNPSPVEVASGGFADGLVAGPGKACGLDVSGAVSCAGGAHGIGADTGTSYDGLALGGNFALVFQSEGAAYGAGANGRGQLGIGSDEGSVSTPERVVFSTAPLSGTAAPSALRPE